MSAIARAWLCVSVCVCVCVELSVRETPERYLCTDCQALIALLNTNHIISILVSSFDVLAPVLTNVDLVPMPGIIW